MKSHWLPASLFATLCGTALFTNAVAATFSSGLQQTQLVELYTSEGCSSCPPADRWLSRYKHNPELWKRWVPIAWHVDYWDYLGWKDPYAKTIHSDRQQNLYLLGQTRSVYTPQVVVGGNEWRGIFLGKTKAPQSSKEVGVLALSTEGERFSATFPNHQNTALTLHIAWLDMGIEQSVNRGENHGRTLRHEFVVKNAAEFHSENGEWNGVLPSGQSGAEALAAWVTLKNGERPIQALGGFLE